MTFSRLTIVTVAAAAALAACGGDDDSSAPSATSPPTPPPSDTSAPSDGEGPPTSSCVGTPGDGEGADLSTVEVKLLGDNLQVTFRTEAPLPTGDSILYTVDAWDMNGQLGSQLGVEIDRRERLTQFVLTYPEETKTEVEDGDVEVGESVLVATYPMDMLISLGDQFEWSATVKIGADPADSCPSVGSDPLEPERVGFSK